MLENNSRYYLRKNQAQPYNLYCKVIPVMAETLGELIIRRMTDLGIRNNSELARLIKRSDAYVGDLINDRGKTKSGTYKPRPATLANLSRVLQISEIEILKAIGYAPENPAPGQFAGLERLSPRNQELAKRQIKALIDTLAEQEHNFDYGDFGNE